MKKEKKQKKVAQDRASFYQLLNKAIQPTDQLKVETKESQTSDDYSDKQTRQRKAEDAED